VLRIRSLGSQGEFEWNPDKKGNFVDIEDGKVTNKGGGGGVWGCALSDETFTSGEHIWYLKIRQYGGTYAPDFSFFELDKQIVDANLSNVLYVGVVCVYVCVFVVGLCAV